MVKNKKNIEKLSPTAWKRGGEKKPGCGRLGGRYLKCPCARSVARPKPRGRACREKKKKKASRKLE